MIKKGLTSVVIFFLYLISLLPLPMLYVISDVLYIITYYLIKYRRNVVTDNLRNSFPDKTAAELEITSKKYYRYLCDMVLETVKLLTISEDEVARRMVCYNVEIFEQIFSKGQSIIGAVGHYGNWELAALRTSQLISKKGIIIYKPLSNAAADDMFKKMRSRFGAIMVPMKGILRKLIELKNEPTLSVFVSDQTPVREEAHYFTQFLNQPTAVFLGIEKTAIMLNSAVVFCDIRVVKRGYYSCTFVPLFDNPKQTTEHQITEAHVRYLENVINQEPQYWLWSHRRWKFKPRTE